MKRRAAFLGPVAACALLCGVLACQQTTPPPVATSISAADSADQFMVGMRVNVVEGGIKRATIFADTAYFFDDNTRLRMHNVSGEFYTSTGAPDGRMTGKLAHYNLRNQHLEAFGDVVVVSVEGRRLNTPHLVYDQAQNEIHGDSAFTMTDPESTFEGVGFVSDPGLTSIRIGRNIRGRAGTVNLPDR